MGRDAANMEITLKLAEHSVEDIVNDRKMVQEIQMGDESSSVIILVANELKEPTNTRRSELNNWLSLGNPRNFKWPKDRIYRNRRVHENQNPWSHMSSPLSAPC